MSDDKKKNVKRYIRAIHFDLDTHALKKQYPTDNWHKAYKNLRRKTNNEILLRI